MLSIILFFMATICKFTDPYFFQLQEKVKEVRTPVKVEKDNIALSVRNHKVKALKAQIESRRQHVQEGKKSIKRVLYAIHTSMWKIVHSRMK